MDRVTASKASSAEIPHVSSEEFDGSNSAETASPARHQLGGPSEVVDRSGSIEDDRHSEIALESPTLVGRPDIDTAMLDALRDVVGSDHGSGAPAWARTDRDQIAVVYGPTNLGHSTCTSSPPSRADIDSAMLDALRHAIGSDTWSRDA